MQYTKKKDFFVFFYGASSKKNELVVKGLICPP